MGEAVSVVGEEGHLGTGDSVSWLWLEWAGPLSSTLPGACHLVMHQRERQTDRQTEIQEQGQTEALQGAGGLGGTCAWLDEQERLQVRERHPPAWGRAPPPVSGLRLPAPLLWVCANARRLGFVLLFSPVAPPPPWPVCSQESPPSLSSLICCSGSVASFFAITSLEGGCP